MNRIAAIVVTYNRKEKLLRCIEAIVGQTAELKPDIFIVDNGSTDGTEDMIRGMIKEGEETGKRIIYENLRHNSGCAGGFCFGVRRAAEAGYDRLWLMDDDCIPTETALEELIQADKELNGRYGFLSSLILRTDGEVCRMNLQRETMYRCVKDPERRLTAVTMASFASLFLPADVVKDVGLPIREFFIWTDDWEYTRRISLRYPCYMAGRSIVIHDTGFPDGAAIDAVPSDRLDRFRYLYRNDVYLYRREGMKGFCYESVRLLWHLGRITAGRYSLKDKAERAGILLRGTIDGLMFYPVPDRVMAATGQQRNKRGAEL